MNTRCFLGQWRSKDDCKPEKEVSFYMADHQVLSYEKSAQEKSYRLAYDSNAGLTCGEMLSFGAPDLAGEQRFFNLPEHTWTSSSLENEVDIFGFPTFSCSFKILNDTRGHLVAKLCDVFPDGKSRLLSYGVINLNHYKSDQKPEELVQGQRYCKEIVCFSIKQIDSFNPPSIHFIRDDLNQFSILVMTSHFNWMQSATDFRWVTESRFR